MKAKLLFIAAVISSQILFNYNSYSHPRETPFPKPAKGLEDYDVNNFPGGVYFYKLDAGEFSETKRIILLK